MYNNEIIESAKKLREYGLNLSQISKELNLSRSTLREWFSENGSNKQLEDFFTRFEKSPEVRASYYYLLGQYLGDGHISKNSRTLKLRIFATLKYDNIINEITNAMSCVFPDNKVYQEHKKNCEAITVNSNQMNVIFPQHGEGKKHTRKIELVDWQLKYLEENSRYLARGLFHSDGCRFSISSGFAYSFTNCSMDIHLIYQTCLELNDIEYTFNSKKVAENNSPAWVTVMYRKLDVKKAYAFLGEKS